MITCYRCNSEYRDGKCGCKDGITLVHGDCREVMPQLEAESIDLVLTDPPYGIPNGACFWRKSGTSLEDWGAASHNRQVEDWLQLCPVAKNAMLLEFLRGHPEAIETTASKHRTCGWTPWHMVFIVKASPPPTPRPTFASGYEGAMVSYRGKRTWFGNGYVPNRWIGQTPNARGVATHPTQKPLEAIALWLSPLCPENGLVLDPFCGSGTTLVAAKNLGRRAIGIDVEERWLEVAANRLRQGILPYRPDS